jgi:glycosyltransferase involved in cell wall biosynthesis
MRILALEREPSLRRGGQERSFFDICRGLAAAGHEIELLYTEPGDLLDAYRRFCRRVDRVAAYTVDRARTVSAAGRFVLDALQIGRGAPDVIYANQYLDSPFARVLAARFNRPFVCHLRLPPPDELCGQYRWGMRGAARLIAISNQTRDDYAARGFRADRIDVVYNGIDPEAWRPRRSREDVRRSLGIDPEALLIVYAGRLHPGKGIETLIDAVASLTAPVRLIVAGRERPDGSGRDYEAELRAHAGRRRLEGICQFVGHVDAPADLYGAADVTVLPSLVAEAFGRVIIESMACGTPAIGSRTGGVPEVLTGEFSRYLFDKGDSSALASRLELLHDWRARDPGLAGRCRLFVEQRFDLSKSIAGVDAALRRTVSESSAGTLASAATSALH